MKITIDNVKIGSVIYTFDKTNRDYPIKEICVRKMLPMGRNIWNFGFNTFYNEEWHELYDSIDSAIDRLRYVYPIDDFTNRTVYLYLPYLTQCINSNFKLYVVDKYFKRVRECYACKILYTNTWKITLMDSVSRRKTTHSISSLGLTIYFDKENALRKLESLK